MTLAICMLNTIFPLHTKMQDGHLKYPKYAILKCHNVIKNLHLKKLLMLTNSILLEINKCDTLKPPGI